MQITGLKNILIFICISNLHLFAQDINSDTLWISGNSVIFFEISQVKYLNLSSTEIFRIDSLISKLHHLRDRVIPFFRKHSIKVKSSDSRNFKILTGKDTILVNSENYFGAGVILCCLEKPPLIFPYNITEAELLSKAQNYFKEYLSK